MENNKSFYLVTFIAWRRNPTKVSFGPPCLCEFGSRTPPVGLLCEGIYYTTSATTKVLPPTNTKSLSVACC
jgi:hypothetical protein